jgi:hypothetical protein
MTSVLLGGTLETKHFCIGKLHQYFEYLGELKICRFQECIDYNENMGPAERNRGIKSNVTTSLVNV